MKYSGEFVDTIKIIPPQKLTLFFESVAHFIQDVPLNMLSQLVEIFVKLIKFGDDITIGLLKRAIGLDEAIKISKYVDDIGEEGFKQLKNFHSIDEIYEMIFKKGDNILDFAENPALLKKMKELNINEAFEGVRIMTNDEFIRWGADLAVEASDDGTKVLLLTQDYFNNIDKITDYSLLHEYYEAITMNSRLSRIDILRKINSNELLNQLPQSIKDELQEVIYDRLIADKALIQEYPEMINELINIDESLDTVMANFLGKEYENLKFNLVKISYYEVVTDKSLKESLFLNAEIAEYYDELIKTMEEIYNG